MNLLNPSTMAIYDPSVNRIVLTLRDGWSGAVVELDPDDAPALINGLMNARHEAKRTKARKAIPSAPTTEHPTRLTFRLGIPRLPEPDAAPIRLRRGRSVGVASREPRRHRP
jgi:hypothetical protein